MCLGSCSAKRAPDANEPWQIGQVGGVALRARRQVQQSGQVGQRGEASRVVSQERSVGKREPECALSEVISHAEQVVDLAEAAAGTSLCPGQRTFAAPHEGATPSIRRAVGERPEQRAADSGLTGSGNEGQFRVQGLASGRAR